MKLRELLAHKSCPSVHCIHPEASLQEAVDLLVRHNIGSLIVIAGSTEYARPQGIITERDILRALVRVHHPLSAYFVGDFMTRRLISAAPDDNTADAMCLMTEHRVRHLPIFEDQRLVGLISIGDLVKQECCELSFENYVLKQYIGS